MSLEYHMESELNTVRQSENPALLGSEHGDRSGVTRTSRPGGISGSSGCRRCGGAAGSQPPALQGFPQLNAAALCTFAAFDRRLVGRGTHGARTPRPGVGASEGLRGVAGLFAVAASPFTTPCPGPLPSPFRGWSLGTRPRNPSPTNLSTRGFLPEPSARQSVPGMVRGSSNSQTGLGGCPWGLPTSSEWITGSPGP